MLILEEELMHTWKPNHTLYIRVIGIYLVQNVI